MKNLYLTLAGIFIFILTGTAQEIEWQNTIGGNNWDWLKSIKQTIDGGYLLGGGSASNISGDKLENSLGSYDYWIVKTDSSGNLQWQSTIGSISHEFLESIQHTSDGGFILGGLGLDGINTYCWIIKMDSNGIIQWQESYGGLNNTGCGEIQQTQDGGYILAGSYDSNFSSFDYWIVKIDMAGNIQWQNTIGGNDLDWLSTIRQTFDGGFILGGYSQSNISGDKTENSFGFDDYWIVKIDSIGSIQWQKTIGGSSFEKLCSIEQTNDGGYVLGGYSASNSSGSKSENSKGGYDYWILKLDSIGDIIWQRTIGGASDDRLESLKLTTDGGYILGGYSISNLSGDKAENCVGLADYWIINTDSIGNIQWQNVIGGNNKDELYAIEQTTDNGYIAGGYSRSDASGDKSENCLGLPDYWVVKLTVNFNLIKGKLFADLNSNGIQDNGEPPLPTRKIAEPNSGRFAFSEQNGNYSVLVLDSGNFSVSPQSVNWYTPIPISQPAIFTGINQTDSLNDFAFQPQGTFEDVCITITPLGNFRSGFTASYMISYGNYGNTAVTPTVYFYPYINVTFQSATLTPSQITPDSVIWNLPALTPFQTGSIIVTVNVNLGLPIGTLINSSAHIEPYATDDNPSCNNSNWEVYTTGSFDPNDIIVSEDTLTTIQLSASPWLEYIIRFQNTGNDTAFTVKILNPIDTNKLDISSIEFVNASHPVNINWINYQRNMEFKFDNILLPDSNTNEPLSHGFVRYRIQPKTTLNAGDTIPNFAAIYFDFNEPVITNTAKTIIVLPTGLANSSPTPSKLLVFPNPAENSISISGIQLENGKAQLRLMDIYGKLILEKTITETTAKLETNQLAKGVYLIQCGGSRAAFVKQ